MSGFYQLRLFGRPALIGPDGRAVRFRTRKHLALLVYLHLEAESRGAPRNLLIDLLWPSVDAAHGRHSLSQALSVFRKLLGPSVVSRGSGAVRLLEAVETDLDRLAQGHPTSKDLTAPLAGLESCAKSDFAHWVDSVRARLTRTAANALREQLTRARDSGNVMVVHEQAGLLYQVDPLSDVAVQAIAEQHLLAEDGVGAIRLLRDHTERVRRELSCDPHPELKRLADRLESGTRSHTSVLVAKLHEEPQPVPLFIGRDRELARLESLWSRARTGRLVTCLISGIPGVGKSSLVERFTASIVSRAWPAISLTCPEIGHDIPFAVIADLIYGLGEDPQTSGAEPEWLGEASRLAPGLRSRYPGIPKPATVAPEAVKLRAAEAIAHIISVVGDSGPMLLAFDNVHHMDPVSAEILHLVLRRLEQSPLLVVGTARGDQEISVPTGETWDSIKWRVHEPLAPFSAHQASALINELTRDQAPPIPRSIQGKIVELSVGIPYLIELLVSDWIDSGDNSLAAAELAGGDALYRWQPSDMMRRAFARQLAGLDEAVQSVLSLLAVAERPLEQNEISDLLQVSAKEMHRVNLQLLRRGIVRLADRGLMFKNELHRAFVYRAMDQDTQRYLHQLMASRGSPTEKRRVDPPTTELERSHHLHRSGDVSGAVASAIEGARAALERGAFREVEHLLAPLGNSKGSSPPIQLALILAQARCAQGHFRSALEAISDVQPVENADRVFTARVRAEASLRGRLGNEAEVRSSVTDYIQLATTLAEPAELLHSIQLGLESATDDGDIESIRALRATARQLASSSSDLLARARAVLAEGYCRLLLNEESEAASSFCEAASVFRALRDRVDLIQCLKGVGVAYAATGAYDSALAFYNDAADVARQANDSDTLVILLSNMSVIAQDRGEFETAIRYLLNARKTVDASSNPRRAVQVCINAANVFSVLQRLDVAEALISEALLHAERASSWRLMFNALVHEANLHLTKGEIRDALDGLSKAEAERQGRSLFLVASGAYVRLKRYAVWASQGHEGFAPVQDDQTTWVTLVDQLSVAAIDAWSTYGRTGRWPDSVHACVQSLTRLGLFGVVADLHSIGVGVPGLVPDARKTPYTAVRVVAEHFRDQMSSPDFGVLDVLAREFLDSTRTGAIVM